MKSDFYYEDYKYNDGQEYKNSELKVNYRICLRCQLKNTGLQWYEYNA